MVAIPLLSGITAQKADFALSYPKNLELVPMSTGIADGYIRSAPGIATFGSGPGADRGGIAWNDVLHRVMGTKLVSVGPTGVITTLADVGGAGPISIDYGFDRLAIRSGTSLYYWNGMALTEVTDPDLGPVRDMLWITGYYVTTDGTSLIVTQLSDPTQVDPLKYGSAEEDPDMIEGVFKLRGELYALGRYTIQPFENTGGSGFPFTPNPSATIPIGICGTNAKCAYWETLAFTGSGRNEGLSVFVLDGGNANKISTRWVDDELAALSDPTSITMESRMSRDERRLYVHLPDKSLVYLANASRMSGKPVWYVADSEGRYRGQNAVYCYGKWIVGDPTSNNIGILDETIATHYGDPAGWQFDTTLIYNKAMGGIVHDLELVGLPGRGPGQPTAYLSFTEDGETFSMERANRQPALGYRNKRVTWNPHRRFRRYMGMRFRGTSEGIVSFASLEANIEPLNV